MVEGQEQCYGAGKKMIGIEQCGQVSEAEDLVNLCGSNCRRSVNGQSGEALRACAVEGYALGLCSANEIMKAEFYFRLLKIIFLYMSILERLEYTGKQKVENKYMKWRFLEILMW